jgi:hypothetical protein
MSTPLQKAIYNAAQRVRIERTWYQEHGGNLSGYIARYGRADDPERYGDGGPAIHAADKAALDSAEAELKALLDRQAQRQAKAQGSQS